MATRKMLAQKHVYLQAQLSDRETLRHLSQKLEHLNQASVELNKFGKRLAQLQNLV